MNCNNRRVSYDALIFDSFGVEHIPEEIKKFIGNKNIANISRIQAFDSIMCGCFCTGFIAFMLKDKSLLDYTNLSSNDYEKNDKIIIKYFQYLKRRKKFIALFAGSIEKLKNLKYHTSWKKTLVSLYYLQ